MPNYHPAERSFFYGGSMDMHLQIISRMAAKKIGMTYYFTGIPCKHGHISTRNTKNKTCHECVRKRFKDWHIRNKEKQSLKSKTWRTSNPERYSFLMSRARKERNKDELNEYMRAFSSRRRAATRGGDSARLVLEWTRSQKKTCLYCGKDCDDEFHVDHFVPISRGGCHKISNLVISCPGCNMRKGAAMPYLFIGLVYGYTRV